MERNVNRKNFYVFVICLLLLGILFACSNSKDETNEPNVEQNEEENYENNASGSNHDHPNADESDHDDNRSNNNEADDDNLASKDEENVDDKADHEQDEQSDANGTNNANNTNDVNAAPGDSDIVDENEIEMPEQPDKPQTPTIPTTPEPNDTPNERPTLRSPVTSTDDPRTLRIGTLNLAKQDQTSFRESFTERFEWDHPNVDIEFTSISTEESIISFMFDPPTIDTVAEYRKMLTSDNPPDVLFLGYNDYRALAEEGLLVALNPFLEESELSLDDFEPIVADGLVNPHDGQTYGLTPYFTSSAIIYNKDIFDEMNVPYPHDGMTWEEIFALAKQVTVHDEERDIYGFMFDLFNIRPPLMNDLWHKYFPGLGVQVYDLESEKMVVNHAQWHDAISSIKDLYDAHVFPRDPSEGEKYTASNKFTSGIIAMGVVNYRDLRMLPSTPNWDVVSMPVHPEAPHVGAGTVMEPVIAMNANGRNQLDAWRLIESIHSPEWARDSENKYWYRLSSRKDHAVNLSEQDYNKAAFYQLRPALNYDNEPVSKNNFSYPTINNKYIRLFSLSKVFSGELTIEEALEDWEHRGNTIIFNN